MQAHAAMIKVAGPYLNADGDMAGSLLIVEAQTLAEAQTFADGDPFAKGGLFATSSIRPWRVTLGGLA
jgi:uncharacterized protein YciI